MSWTYFSYQLSAKLTPASNKVSAVSTRLPEVAASIDSLFNRHFEMSSGMGKLIPAPARVAAFQAGLRSLAIANRANPRANALTLNAVLQAYTTAYWSGRVIDGPLATITTIAPTVWIPIDNIPNFVPSAKQWIDKLAVSLYIQKMSIIGVRVQKPTPIITPWSGALLMTMDSPLASALSGIMVSGFSNFMNLLVAQGADAASANAATSQYSNAVTSIFSNP